MMVKSCMLPKYTHLCIVSITFIFEDPFHNVADTDNKSVAKTALYWAYFDGVQGRLLSSIPDGYSLHLLSGCSSDCD